MTKSKEPISILVILLLLIASSPCEAIIILTSANDNCPGGLQCMTLQQYANNPSQNSSAVLELQPGNHSLSSQLNVANIVNFTITGNNSQVVCIPGSGEISLTSVQHVLIIDLSFIGCDRNVLSTNGDSVEIRNTMFSQNVINIIEIVTSVVVVDSTFDGNSDTGLDLTNIESTATIVNCVFSNNGRRGITAVSTNLDIRGSTFFKNSGPQGGCISAQSSRVDIVSSNFTQCTSIGGHHGGAIYGQQVIFTITNTNFMGNQGYTGGGIRGDSSSFNITSSEFVKNIGDVDGGAIYAGSGTTSFNLAETNFISNIADRTGGAVYTFRLDSLVCGDFINNTAVSGNGGGVYVNTHFSVTISHCNFWNNTCDGGGLGGAGVSIVAPSDTATVNVIGSNFVNNVVQHGNGGGLYFRSNGQLASMMIAESSFRNNTATSLQESLRNRNTVFGGGVYMSGGNSSISIDSSEFSMNCASGSGGGVYMTGSIVINSSNFTKNSALLGEGGAIHCDGRNANVTLINSMFDYNSAPSCGALDVNERFHVIEFQDCSFTHNTATGTEIGGGACCISSASLSVINSNMSHNAATMNGGVFNFNGGVVEIRNSNFINNSAEGHGGVVYTYIHPVSYNILESTFRQNTARNDGGVMYIGRRSSNVHIRESEFAHNSATESGGIISIVGSSLIFNTTNFYNNSANKGEIISACNSIVSLYNDTGQVQTQISRDMCTFFDNTDSYSLSEPINGTSGFDQANCTDCDVFIILTSSGNYCPGEFTGDPCLTLQQYVASPSFEANISLIFEPGNHTLTGELSASDSYNYTMVGSGAKIICDTSAAEVSLTSVQHVLIIDLSFIGCDRNVLSTNGGSVEIRNAMFNQNEINMIELVTSVVVVDSTFDGNSDTGLDLTNIESTATIVNCVFSNNGRRGITAVSTNLDIHGSTFFNNRGPQGGCIRAQSSRVDIVSSNFTQCTSIGGHHGGAIYGQQVTFTIMNTKFMGNQGYTGGGIRGDSSSFNITSSKFFKNIGDLDGGAIYAGSGTTSFSLADTNFISNIAGRTGGAVYTFRLDSLVCGDFINNTAVSGDGGGLFLDTLLSVTISYCNFWNSTCGEGGFGGAGVLIILRRDYISVNVIGSSFMNNAAVPGHGGGLHFRSRGQHALMTITESSFINNSANLLESVSHRQIINGGGIYLSGTNSSVFIDKSNFSMNTASVSGGAIYVTGSIFINDSTISNNRAIMGEGGGIVSDQQNAHVSVTRTTFIHNTAPTCGAISVQNYDHTVTLIDSSFAYNEGTNHSNGGGGVACFNDSSTSIITSSFLANMANYNGGVFIFQYSTFRLEESHFHSNLALKDGGVIYSSTTFLDPSTIYQCSFIQNTAGSNGGVLFMQNTGNLLNISHSRFSNNNATSSGGAIYVSESAIQITETNIFNNSADLGDAIQACGSDVTLQDSQFTISTDSSNCTSYDGDVDSFVDFMRTIDIESDSNLTTFFATCPFENDLDSVTTSVTETITTPQATMSTEARAETTTTAEAISTGTEATTEIITTTIVSEVTNDAETTNAITNDTETTDAITPLISTEHTSESFNQETSTTLIDLDTTSAINTEASSSTGESVLLGAVIGGIVVCLALLLLVVGTIIGGYCLYRSGHKNSRKYNVTQETGMSFKNKNFTEVQQTSNSDVIETKVNSSEGSIEQCEVFEGPKEDIKAEYMKCPVCKEIQVDPCTLQCGHTVCQLCLARMWKRQSQFCPLCKDHWQVYPAITIDYRDNIEKLYSDEIVQLRNSYTPEDKELIKEFLSNKNSFSPASDTQEQEIEQDVTSEYEELQLTPASELSEPLLYQSLDDKEDNNERWLSQSVKEESTQEPNIYAAPRHKSVGSKSSIKLSHIRIKNHPESDVNIKYLENVTLSVTAVGAKPPCYKWRRNGQDITHSPKCSGIDNSTLTISCFSPEHEGDYTCIVSDGKEVFESAPAKLKLDLQITKQPQLPPSVKYGDYVAITVSAVGDQQSLSYLWKLNGKDIDLDSCTGTNTRILVIKSCSFEHQGTFTCTVNSIRGTIESKPAELKLKIEFETSMPANDFYLWLQLGGLSEEDLQALKCHDKILTAQLFERLNSDMINGLKLSTGGKLVVNHLLDEIKGRREHIDTAAVKQEHSTPKKGLEVKIGDLHVLKRCDKSGKTMKTVKIINSVSHRWRQITSLLSDDTNKAEILSQKFNNDPHKCLEQLFKDCFIKNKPAVGRYSQDWDGLIELLEDIDEAAIAEKVREMVTNS